MLMKTVLFHKKNIKSLCTAAVSILFSYTVNMSNKEKCVDSKYKAALNRLHRDKM